MQLSDRSGPLQLLSALRTGGRFPGFAGVGSTPSTPARRNATRWLAGIGIITGCSWVRCLATGSPKVDESYPTLAVGMALFAGLAAGWGLLVWGWTGWLSQPPSAAEARRLAFAGLLLAAPMLPLLSNDVFSLLGYGSVAASGHDVYATAAWLPDSALYLWVGAHWSSTVCVYGPTTLVAAMPASLFARNVWAALFVLRLSWFLPLAAAMELSFRWGPSLGEAGDVAFRSGPRPGQAGDVLPRPLSDRPFFHAMVWLNPLFVVEGAGQLHADVLGLVALVVGVSFALRRQVHTGWVFYALAVLGKYTFVFAGPWFWLLGAGKPRERLWRLGGMAAVLAALGAVFYAPFWRGTATLTEPVRTLARMIPGGSIVEIVGHLVHVARGGAVPPASLPPELAVEMERQAKGPTWLVASLVLRVVFVVVALRQLQGLLRRGVGERGLQEGALAAGTGALIVAAITLASHRFQSWYLMAALPFFGLSCQGAWRRWWVLVVTLSVATEFVHVLPRDAALLPVWSVITNGGVVVVFLAWFRERFLRLPPSSQEPSAEPAASAR